MEEILFWVIDCRDCATLQVVDHVVEDKKGDIMCPTCCCANTNMWVQGFGGSVFDHFSEEACLKIHDALTRHRARPLADEMRAKIKEKREE